MWVGGLEVSLTEDDSVRLVGVPQFRRGPRTKVTGKVGGRRSTEFPVGNLAFYRRTSLVLLGRADVSNEILGSRRGNRLLGGGQAPIWLLVPPGVPDR